MEAVDRLFLAEQKRQKIILEAIARDLRAGGIEPRRIEVMIGVVDETIAIYEEGVEKIQKENAEAYKREQERGQEWVEALRSRASEPTSSEGSTTKWWKTLFRRS